MSQFVDTVESVDLGESLRLLVEKIESFKSGRSKANSINRIAIEINADISIIDILKTSKVGSKIYWSDRSGDFESAGLGEALKLTAADYGDIEKIINQAVQVVSGSDDGVRIFGGIRFPSASKNGSSSDWKLFGAGRFVVPRIEIVRNGSHCELVCNMTESDFDRADSIFQELESYFEGQIPEETIKDEIISRIDLPAFDGWDNAVNSILSDFRNGEIEKIVLARQTTIQFKNECDAPSILKKLSAATPACYHFYFEPGKGTVFLGASPEQLYSRRNREITSEALAGTRPRGADQNTDQKLGQELLQSEKELREHKYVVDNIKAAFSSVCENYSVLNESALLKLAQVQHLRTEFKGKLRPEIIDADIIQSLHPTSAVGGFPSTTAQNRIAQYEEFERGWYAGAVGWLSKDAAEMAVAIRSGLVNGRELKLHSGAGIISGSTAQGEWEEIESKIASFLNAVSD